MKKILAGAFLGTSFLLTPESFHALDHEKVIIEINRRTQKILELKQEERNTKLRKIKDAIDNNINKESRVLLIGISRYKYLVPLEAHADIEQMKELLMDNYDIPAEHIVVLEDKKVTKKRVLRTIRKLSEETPDKKKFIIYFSGHGIALDKDFHEVTDFKGDYTGYISTHYSKIRYSKDGKKIFEKESRISKKEINDAVGNEQEMLFIVDACYGGALAKDLKKNETLVSASNSETAVSYGTSVFSGAIYDIISSNKRSIGDVITTSSKEIGQAIKEGDSTQQPLVKTPDMIFYIKNQEIVEDSTKK